jgi:hypothetical protein
MNAKLLIALSVSLFVNTLAQGTYPLQIGNVWQYRDSFDSTYGWTYTAAKDTLLPNGKTYTMFALDNAALGPLLRQEGSKVFINMRIPTSDTTYDYHEDLRYDFSKTTGDTVRATVLSTPNGIDTVVIRVIDDAMLNVFGKLRRTWIFYENSKRVSSYSKWWVSDSIGLIHTEGEAGIVYSLFGAIINGIRYGTITKTEASSPIIPKEYSIYQNYPNPFNPSTTIEFKIPKEKYLTLVIYNILGEQIRSLFAGNMASGSHRIIWDAKSDLGGNVSSGIYFYQIKTDDFVEIKKMILLR